MSLENRIISAGRHLERIAARLTSLGYEFDKPSEVFPGPEHGTEAAIKRIEREIGELPAAIKVFWRRVGSVNFMGKHPVWRGCEFPDPVVVYRPSYAVDELDQFLADRQARLHCGFPYLVPIGPDDLSKENVSGGMWYNLSVPAVADDPTLNDERHRTTLVNYLELAV